MTPFRRSLLARLVFVAVLIAAGQAWAGSARAAGVQAGPVEALVTKVIDGDSFKADAIVWPGTTVSVSIRIRGIDAPELRARCGYERHLARLALKKLGQNVLAGKPLQLINIGGDKYYGRVLADVRLAGGADLATAMPDSGTVRRYAGRKRQSWCTGRGPR